ncbi:MAG: hypothetical protein ACK5EA_26855, partial [Planctomycetaceae bacterium]
PDLTQRILETYQTIGKINHLGHCPLPSLNSVIGASVSLMKSVPPKTMVTVEKPNLKFRER